MTFVVHVCFNTSVFFDTITAIILVINLHILTGYKLFVGSSLTSKRSFSFKKANCACAKTQFAIVQPQPQSQTEKDTIKSV